MSTESLGFLDLVEPCHLHRKNKTTKIQALTNLSFLTHDKVRQTIQTWALKI